MEPKYLVGQAHWQRQNQQWRGQSSSQGLNSRPSVLALSPRKYDYVFRKLVVDRKQLKQPLPLTDLIPMLVYGWKKTGVWPTDQPTT